MNPREVHVDGTLFEITAGFAQHWRGRLYFIGSVENPQPINWIGLREDLHMTDELLAHLKTGLNQFQIDDQIAILWDAQKDTPIKGYLCALMFRLDMNQIRFLSEPRSKKRRGKRHRGRVGLNAKIG